MSETLLNYINKEVKLSKKIKSIDIDFKNGYLFAELLSKTGFLNSNYLSQFNKNAKTKQEIKLNFILLNQHLSYLGIHLDDFTINEIVNNTKGSIPALLYKIKTQIDRGKIKFDDIMTKLIKYQKEDKIKNSKENKKMLNKTSYTTKTDFSNDSNKLPQLTYMSTFYGTTNNFNSIKRKTPNFTGLHLNNLDNNFKFPENNKFVNDKILNEKKISKKLKPLSPKNINLMPIMQNKKKIETKTNFNENNNPLNKDLNKDNNNNVLNEIEEKTDSEINFNSKFYQQQQKKFKSHGKNEQKIKIFSEKYLENNNKYMKYSCFDRNTLRIGIDLKEIDAKLYKQGIGYNNDFIPNEIVLERLKNKVNQKEEEYKKKWKKKNL